MVREVQYYLSTETKSGIPAIFHEEAITGFATQGATTFPQQIGVGCSWNPKIVEQNTASTSKNMRAAGATFALSPMLDLSRTAHWNRLEESYGEDAYLTSRMGVAFVNGLQGFSGYLESLGMPMPMAMAWMAKGSEFFGGALLIIGLFTRISSVFLLITMVVAVFVANGGNITGDGELAFVYLITCFAILIHGPGKLSLDHILFKEKT